MKYEAAGDQYVGRVVSGLPLCSAKFAVLPPQLVDCSVEEAKTLVKFLFPGIMSHLHCACKFFACSLLFHFNTLKEIISTKHPLLIASFLTYEKIGLIRPKISVSYAWEEESLEVDVFRGRREEDEGLLSDNHNTDNHNTGSTAVDNDSSLESDLGQMMTVEDNRQIRKATGIPMHVMLMADMQRVVSSQQQVLIQLRDVISTELDKREVGHSTFQVQSQVKDMLQSFESRIIKKFDECNPTKSEANGSDVIGSSPSGGKWYIWGGQYRRVPRDFQFPNKMTLKTA